MKVDTWFSDEPPMEAKQLIEQFELAAEEIRQIADREIAAIKLRADEEIGRIRSRADGRLQSIFGSFIAELAPLQQRYAKAGQLDEALAIRDAARRLRAKVGDIQADPGCIHIATGDQGKSFVYEVTGRSDGGLLYGTDIYCGDSELAAAVVHAGLLAPGQKGLVRVTILEQQHPRFIGSTRNGVTSTSWDYSYSAFEVSKY